MRRVHHCRSCDHAFQTTSHLHRHELVHTGERSFKCPYIGCKTRTSRKDNLNAHIKAVHKKPKSWPSSAQCRFVGDDSGFASDSSGSSTRSVSNSPPGRPAVLPRIRSNSGSRSSLSYSAAVAYPLQESYSAFVEYEYAHTQPAQLGYYPSAPAFTLQPPNGTGIAAHNNANSNHTNADMSSAFYHMYPVGYPPT
ncbi:Cell wall integrity transcriptional regulator CAS5 [Mycena kentingensis (nom. inval.)]|nr:Cell wall integrity transcriptional regulator CAS5 [Mycena kentingensis (nom. inval.)]